MAKQSIDPKQRKYVNALSKAVVSRGQIQEKAKANLVALGKEAGRDEAAVMQDLKTAKDELAAPTGERLNPSRGF